MVLVVLGNVLLTGQLAVLPSGAPCKLASSRP